MITVNIGRTFLRAYNQKFEKELTAKEFFEQEYFELFFNHPKYLQWAGNSEFVQGIRTMKNGKVGIQYRGLDDNVVKFESKEKADEFVSQSKWDTETEVEIRKEKNNSDYFIVKTLNLNERKYLLNKFFIKVDKCIAQNDIESSMAIGFPASEVGDFGQYSGLITDIPITTNLDEILFSWIGSSLSIGVSGGFSILFNQPEILLQTYEGWKVYREFLNNPTLDRLSGNKITSWNGQWLSYSFSRNRRPDFDYASFDRLGFFKVSNIETVIETVKWSKLFFNLSNHFQQNTFIAYVFSLGEKNKTLGFFPFKFHQAQKLISLYEKLFGVNAAINEAPIYEEIFGLKFYKACQLGAIGIQALRPEQLLEDIKNDKKIELIKLRTYKIWLLAMINKEETLNLTNEISEILHLYKTGSKGTERKALVEKKLLQSGKRNFLIHWEEIVIALPEKKVKLKEISDKVFYMETEEFGYFIALLKLDYRYQEK